MTEPGTDEFIIQGTPCTGGSVIRGRTPSGGRAVEVSLFAGSSVKRAAFSDWRTLRDLARLMLDAAAEMRAPSG